MDAPKEDSERTIHALNIHGVFFHKLIASIISQHPHAQLVATEYPVEFPPGHPKAHAQESRLDIRAWLTTTWLPNARVNLVIECKKANPEFVDWIFFPRLLPPNDPTAITLLASHFVPAQADNWNLEYTLLGRRFLGLASADDARETRGSFEIAHRNVNTKTSNAAISDAAYQVVLATHAVATEDSKIAQTLYYTDSRLRSGPLVYLPIIVTTANLYLCSFEPLDVAIDSGEIAPEKVGLQPVDKVFYEYAIPTHLQLTSDDSFMALNDPPRRDKHVRRHILVLNSTHFKEDLDWLYRSAEHLVNG